MVVTATTKLEPGFTGSILYKSSPAGIWLIHVTKIFPL